MKTMQKKTIDEKKKVFLTIKQTSKKRILYFIFLQGNGFLMLLPGIAIPIDTDANDSDEDATSDSLD